MTLRYLKIKKLFYRRSCLLSLQETGCGLEEQFPIKDLNIFLVPIKFLPLTGLTEVLLGTI